MFILPSVLWLITAVGCQKPAPEVKPETIHLSRVCRVPKNQGQAESCWAYAMTGHLENRLITRNDSKSACPPGSSPAKPMRKPASLPSQEKMKKSL